MKSCNIPLPVFGNQHQAAWDWMLAIVCHAVPCVLLLPVLLFHTASNDNIREEI